jgi:hypothetical protein
VYAPVALGQDKHDQVCLVSRVFDHRSIMHLILQGIDYDGFRFTYFEFSVGIEHFKGSRAISELEVVPLEYYKNAKGLNTQLTSLEICL